MQVSDIWTKSLTPDLLDLAIIAFYLLIIFIISHYIKKKHIYTNPAYQYYVYGLFASIVGAIALGLVYNFYYPGGDTTGYYRSSEAMVNLLRSDYKAYFRLLFGDLSPEALSAFTAETGKPWYTHDYGAFAIVRITSIFTLLGFKNYFTASILFAWFFYIGYWKLYLLFCNFYPKYYKQLAIPILFFPSVLFWGSGILKDTVTLAALAWFIYAIYFLIVKKKFVIPNIIAILLLGYILLVVKPYIVVALMPGLAIWAGWHYLSKIDNPLIKFFISPLILVLFLVLGISSLSLFSENLGIYGSMEGIIQKAIITYEDHLRFEQYGTNFYSLGEFDGTLSNFLAKTPAAVVAGLFRPFVWEAESTFVLLSAIENALLLIFVLYVFLKNGPVRFMRIAFKEPMVIFSLSFAFIFAFAVGVSSGNFGALVRLKIPMIPFFVASFVIIFMKSRESQDELK
ncbi:MAG: hypothetical protein ACOCWC_05965 [Bacteroidota bacterium]